jgi:hypothetical protein
MTGTEVEMHVKNRTKSGSDALRQQGNGIGGGFPKKRKDRSEGVKLYRRQKQC